MLGSELYRLKSDFLNNGIIFCYSGYVTEGTLMGIGDAIKKKMILDETDARTSKIIFSVFVEQVQNMIRYSAEKDEKQAAQEVSQEVRSGILTVGREEKGIFVSCGNKVKAADVPRLEALLTQVQNMDQKELKKAWKDGLRAGPPEGSKGAGIGFIDIARKAKGGIRFDFTPLDDENAFFSLKAYI